MLTIKPIIRKKTWQTFLTTTYKGFPAFFQSWNWGEVQKNLGFLVMRVGLYDNKKLIGISQIVIIKAKRGNYIHLRHGPLLMQQKKEYYKKFIAYLRKIAEERKCTFIRMSPLIEETQKTTQLFSSLQFRDAPIHNMDAEICWVLDISMEEDTILANMRKSHRYLIKKSMKEPIEILHIETVNKDVLSFLSLYKKLATKRNFVPHKGLVEEIEVLGKDKEAVLLLARYQEEIIGGALIDFIGPMAVYHHGATSETHKELSVSYLLQWEAIKEAKKRGKKLYNFWGIAPNESKKHPWYGLTLFKMGFGGEKKTFLHAKDLPLSLMYWKTYAIEMITKIRKSY